jgi:hypothetical protein
MCIVDWIIAVAKNSMGGLAFYILMGIVILFVISVIVTNKDKIHTIIIVTIGAFYLFSKIYCGPNYFDVRVMKPMAEKISDYIVKNGIPESLKDIPDLPYGLEGCERDKEFDYQENCKIENKMMNLYFKHGKYTIDDKIYEEANLEMRHVVNNTTKTGLLMEFEKKNNSFVQVDEVKIYSGKTDGICNSMRQ